MTNHICLRVKRLGLPSRIPPDFILCLSLSLSLFFLGESADKLGANAETKKENGGDGRGVGEKGGVWEGGGRMWEGGRRHDSSDAG